MKKNIIILGAILCNASCVVTIEDPPAVNADAACIETIECIVHERCFWYDELCVPNSCGNQPGVGGVYCRVSDGAKEQGYAFDYVPLGYCCAREDGGQ